MKQFVKALAKDSYCFKYLCKKFPHLSVIKLKVWIFVEPNIYKMMFDFSFDAMMNTKENEDHLKKL